MEDNTHRKLHLLRAKNGVATASAQYLRSGALCQRGLVQSAKPKMPPSLLQFRVPYEM